MGNFLPFLRRPSLNKGSFLALLAVATLVWSGGAAAQSAAQRAVDAAKKICAGKTDHHRLGSGAAVRRPEELFRS